MIENLPSDNEARISVEHLLRLDEGGENEMENLRLAHQWCNNKASFMHVMGLRMEITSGDVPEPTKKEAQTALAWALHQAFKDNDNGEGR